MRAIEFLLEYDARTTLDNLGDALIARCKGLPADPEEDYPWDYQDPNRYDPRGIQLLGLTALRPYTWDEMIISFFEKIDPTQGKFVIPMCNWYISGSMRSLEDAPKLRGPHCDLRQVSQPHQGSEPQDHLVR
jgi:hypothetical protein